MKPNQNYLRTLFLLASLLTGIVCKAKVTLPSVFTDNMVLQQKTNAAIWGKGDAGKTIDISTTWNKKKYTTTVDPEGNWKIKVATPSYGGPYSITISDGEDLVLKNVLIGEVWICSGQSNMQLPLAGWGKINNYQQEIAKAKYPNIRLFQTQHVASNQPLNDAKVDMNGWKPCSPEYISEFSAVAYFFARDIYKKTGIPIGLIHTSWGGTVVEAWMSGSALKDNADFADTVKKIESTRAEPTADKEPNHPTVLYNALIHPFIQYAIRGAIWYQGESNAERANQYRTLFPAMITDWRKQWRIGDFPFYFIQLANYKKTEEEPKASSWAELRDAQLQTLALPKTGMSVTIDIGDAVDIHPKNKQDVGKRLALIALAKTYGVNTPYSGPAPKSQKIEGNRIKIDFKFTDGGLKAKSGELTGFSIAGADQKFHWAKATISGNQITVSSADVPNPVAVRYAWADNPVCNLVNGAGLPASPFRTDNWQDSTFGKK
jgi:sialate O-acetylesterase